MEKLLNEKDILKLKSKIIQTDEDENGIFVNVKDYGASGIDIDGNDDTDPIQQAINFVTDAGGGEVYVPEGIYRINPLENSEGRGLILKDNVHFLLADNAILKTIPNNQDNHTLLWIVNQRNITVEGGTLLGERYEHTSNTGEWGHGILIRDNAKNITIKNIKLSQFWGDGIEILSSYGASPIDGHVEKVRPENIFIDNISCIDNRRQGISIVSGLNIEITNSNFTHTNGVEPHAGIDIEPTEVGDFCKNILIKNCIFEDNEGEGILIHSGMLMSTWQDIENEINSKKLFNVTDVKIEDCKFNNNKRSGISIRRKFSKNISIDNCTFSGNGTTTNSEFEVCHESSLIFLRNCIFQKRGNLTQTAITIINASNVYISNNKIYDLNMIIYAYNSPDIFSVNELNNENIYINNNLLYITDGFSNNQLFNVATYDNFTISNLQFMKNYITATNPISHTKEISLVGINGLIFKQNRIRKFNLIITISRVNVGMLENNCIEDIINHTITNSPSFLFENNLLCELNLSNELVTSDKLSTLFTYLYHHLNEVKSDKIHNHPELTSELASEQDVLKIIEDTLI